MLLLLPLVAFWSSFPRETVRRHDGIRRPSGSPSACRLRYWISGSTIPARAKSSGKLHAGTSFDTGSVSRLRKLLL